MVSRNAPPRRRSRLAMKEMPIARQLLETKLSAPRARPGAIARPRLLEQLDVASAANLVLVSAPAGFGKTTLLVEWARVSRAAGRSVAWLSLDPADNDPATFLAYLVAAFHSVADVARSSSELEGSVGSPPGHAVLTTLLNELAASPRPVALVLDDYHVIDAPEVHESVAFLLEHLPGSVQIVIATRADPALPLAGMRARGMLAEVRAADLRFSLDESDTYLVGAMGVPLAPGDVRALDERTEGWIAALQLAALSMQGRDDPSSFIAGFAGDDRYVVDYLVEEVLRRQPEAIQNFLLETSVLERLTGDLCDAILGAAGSRSVLEQLDRANLFLIALDDRRQWYRYHHLFADVLRARLLDERPERLPVLHGRASKWHEQHGTLSESIGHAIAAADFDRAADLIEPAIRPLSQQRQEATLRRWLAALPERLFEHRPVLAAGSAGMQLVRGDIAGVEARLDQAERWLRPGFERASAHPSEPGMVVVDADAFARLPTSIAMFRTALAFGTGDIEGAIASGERVLTLVAPDDHLERGGAAGFLALAMWTRGDLETADRRWLESAASLEAGGHISDAIGNRVALGDIRIAQGRLTDALRAFRSGVALGERQGAPAVRGVPDMHVGMSAVAFERNDLDQAISHLVTAEEAGDGAALAQYPARSRIAWARIREAEGDLDEALRLLESARRVYASDFYPNVQPTEARVARIWIRQGRADLALAWAGEHELSVEDDLTYLREYEHVTLARLLALTERPVRGSLPARTGLLARLLESADRGGRQGSVIEVLALQALDHHARGEARAAMDAIERALDLAGPERQLRVFIDAGPAMAAVLESVVAQRATSATATELLAALRHDASGVTANRSLAEPLSDREIEVLQLLASDLDGPAIAAALVVSLHTVRSHSKRIYAKLGVGDRRAAVRRAEELHLLPGTHRR